MNGCYQGRSGQPYVNQPGNINRMPYGGQPQPYGQQAYACGPEPGYGMDAQPEKEPSKAMRFVSTAVTVVMALIAFAMMAFTIVSVTTFDSSDRDLFGYKAFIVQSDSMSATDFAAGDLVLVEEVDPATLVEGDIIAFISENDSNYGEVVTHKIRSLTTTEDGQPAFITYGTTTDTDDETPVTYDRVLGRHRLALPNVGTFFAFLKTVPGYIICILTPFLILIGFQVASTVRLFRQYRREQMAALQAERQQMEAERQQMQAMMRQMQMMQAGIAAPQAVSPAMRPAAGTSGATDRGNNGVVAVSGYGLRGGRDSGPRAMQ